ncbi:MAG: HAD hydrolase-like protein [Chloroflexota bacterium]|nr:HAD hydrolase-like protein [Chloroflexota bacterium]
MKSIFGTTLDLRAAVAGWPRPAPELIRWAVVCIPVCCIFSKNQSRNNEKIMDILKYKHIIWDWNGTLLDDVRLSVMIINSLLAKRQLPTISLEYYRKIFAFPVLHYYDKLGFNFSQESFESISTEFITTYERMRSQCDLMSGVPKTLRYISQLGLTQSVLSASKQSYLLQAIVEYGLGETFVEVNGLNNHHASSKVDIGKNFIARSKLDPSNILLIGDTTHDAEVAASISAGCCLISNGHQNQKRLATCGVSVICSLSELCV